eukprot:COSAG01_NODE_1108_length_11662_cov_189.275534_2_plen_174_part_00
MWADTRYLDKAQYYASGLDKTVNKPVVTNPAVVQPGDLLTPQSGRLGGSGLQIYHDIWTPAPNNSWIEILHTTVPTELQGDWVFKLRGTNVWFNVGRTIVFCCAGQHDEAQKFLSAGCSKQIDTSKWPAFESDVYGFCAREKVKLIHAVTRSSVCVNFAAANKPTDLCSAIVH